MTTTCNGSNALSSDFAAVFDPPWETGSHTADGKAADAPLASRSALLDDLAYLVGNRAVLELLGTDELAEIKEAAIRDLMGARRQGDARLLYSMGGRRSRKAKTRRAEDLREWGIAA